jgi:uncharacterized protein YdiU (UPF0061 family)
MYQPAPIHPGLGEKFFVPVKAADFPDHILRYRNDRWAKRVGLAGLSDAEWVDHFGRFKPLDGNIPQPLALKYHGHQFRTYNPDLGDGRGFLFAQFRDDAGRILDLGTKGSGKTPFSRTADGRLTLKGGVRELLATTMLEAFGVNTSKTFSLIETGENLTRHDEPSPTRSSVMVRLSHSHIRIGTFQRLRYEEDAENIERLVDHVLTYYMADVWKDVSAKSASERAEAMLRESIVRVTRTGCQWMAAGFVHGVLNTDNINITGESFDYGPWRFLPHYEPGFTAAYFDSSGLYAYGRQPATLFWNLQRLAQCLLPLCDEETLVAALETFPKALEEGLIAAMLGRLNLARRDPTSDLDFLSILYDVLEATKAPFEQFFFDWQGGRASEARAARSPSAEIYRSAAFAPLKDALAAYEVAVPERLSHPYFAEEKPETLLIEEVESLWEPIAQMDDWKPVYAKCAAILRAGEAYGNL